MSKAPANTFYSCFKYLYRLLFWSGVLNLRNNGHALVPKTWHRYYTFGIRLLLLSGFYGGCIRKLTDEISAAPILARLTPVTKCILAFECLCSTMTYLQLSLVTDAVQQRHKKLVERLKALDDAFVQCFPFVNWNYHKTARKYAPHTIGVSIFYCFVSLVYVFILASSKRDWVISLVIAVSYACITLSPGILGFLHVGYMDLLRLRFRLLTKLMCQFAAGAVVCDASLRDLSAAHDYVKAYTCLIAQMNGVFGYTSVVSVFYDFTVVTNMVFLLCQKATESSSTVKEFVFIALLIVPRIYKITMLAAYGYQTDKEKKRSIHALQSYIYEYDLRTQASLKTSQHYRSNMLVSFLYWQMLSKYELTLGSMIRCKLNVIFMVLNAVANYVLVLIQLQLQQNSIKQQLRANELGNDVEILRKWA